jgi:ribosome-associated toxin RatA of RatAB toxin-antitoxin module
MPIESPPLPDAQTLARLERGETLIRSDAASGSGVPRVLLQAMIDAAPAKVWRHIDDSARYQDFMPRVKKSEELSRAGDVIRSRVTIDMPFPLKNLTATSRAVHTVRDGELYQRAWQMESGDYEVNEGAWTLVPHPSRLDRTLVSYEARVQPKIPLPGALKQMAQEKALPSLVEALRARVKAFG